MRHLRRTLVAAIGALTLAAAPGANAQETLKRGLSVPMSGAAAIRGLGLVELERVIAEELTKRLAAAKR